MEGADKNAVKLRDFWLAGLGIVIGAGTLLLIPHQISGSSLSDIANPASSAFFPIIVAILLIACALLLLFQTVLVPPAEGEQGVVEPLLSWNYVQGAALLTAYVFLVSWIGMLISTGLMIAALSWMFGYRNWPLMIGSAVLVPLSVWFLFRKLLYIVFPSGVLF